jgi:hypothetical protein
MRRSSVRALLGVICVVAIAGDIGVSAKCEYIGLLQTTEQNMLILPKLRCVMMGTVRTTPRRLAAVQG